MTCYSHFVRLVRANRRWPHIIIMGYTTPFSLMRVYKENMWHIPVPFGSATVETGNYWPVAPGKGEQPRFRIDFLQRWSGWMGPWKSWIATFNHRVAFLFVPSERKRIHESERPPSSPFVPCGFWNRDRVQFPGLPTQLFLPRTKAVPWNQFLPMQKKAQGKSRSINAETCAGTRKG